MEPGGEWKIVAPASLAAPRERIRSMAFSS
jgi:hypothetical protein